MVSVLLNRGDGSFQPGSTTNRRRLRSVAIGDLNGDASRTWCPRTHRAHRLRARKQRRRQLPGQARLRNRTPPDSVAIGDLNGDGKPDLATANGRVEGTVSVLLNRGDGSFQARRDYSPAAPAVGRDRRPERRRQAGPGDRERGASTVSVLLNRGDGSFRAKRDYRTDAALARSRSAT